jgi:hypothetical protein
MSSYQEFMQCEHCGYEYASLYQENNYTMSDCPLCRWHEVEISDDTRDDLWQQAEEEISNRLGNDEIDDDERNELVQDAFDRLLDGYIESELGKNYIPGKEIIKAAKIAIKQLEFMGQELNDFLSYFGRIEKIEDVQRLKRFIIEEIFIND